jgi:hypothetical protein
VVESALRKPFALESLFAAIEQTGRGHQCAPDQVAMAA